MDLNLTLLAQFIDCLKFAPDRPMAPQDFISEPGPIQFEEQCRNEPRCKQLVCACLRAGGEWILFLQGLALEVDVRWCSINDCTLADEAPSDLCQHNRSKRNPSKGHSGFGILARLQAATDVLASALAPIVNHQAGDNGACE